MFINISVYIYVYEHFKRQWVTVKNELARGGLMLFWVWLSRIRTSGSFRERKSQVGMGPIYREVSVIS